MKKTAIIAIIMLIVMTVYGVKLQRTQLWPSTGPLQPDNEITDPFIRQQFINIKQWAEKLQQMLDTTFRKVAGIPFNQSESLTVTDSGSANTEFSITHHLGRTPNGFMVTKSDKAASVYDSGTTWTTATIYLKCGTANVALSITVF